MNYSTSRRRFLSTAAVATATGLTGYSIQDDGGAGSDGPDTPDDGLPGEIGLRTVVDGLDAPVAVSFAPGGDRRYVAELDGRILVHGPDGLLDEPLLDIRDSVLTEGEQGLMGMTLHPDFAANRRLFLRYSAPRRPSMRTEYTHRFVLTELEVTDDGTRAIRDSERTVLEIPQLSAFHNAGDVAFGPDGYLYVPVGDSATRRYGQDVVNTLLGSVLRIDVDERPPGHAYAVPEDNPLVDREGIDEYYAWGFRNPWRISFDGDDLYVADVGQSAYEEVNLVERGGNYGWDVKEGTHCFRAEECPDETSEVLGEVEPFRDPIIEYPHQGAPVSGVSVIGGHVYRGRAMPGFEGVYLFGDFLTRERLFAATRPSDGQGRWPTTALDVVDGGENLQRLLSFGRDEGGEVYALGTGESGGGLFRVVPAT